MSSSRTAIWSAAAALFTTCLVTGIVGTTGYAESTPYATVRPVVVVVLSAIG